MKSIRTSLAVILGVVLILIFSGCGAGSSSGSSKDTGSYELSLSWPDGSESGREAKVIPIGSTQISISITGENMSEPLATSVSYSQTSVIIDNVPVGRKIALIKALDSSSNIKAQRKETFSIVDSQTTTSDHIPLGVAITGTSAGFEPTNFSLPRDQRIYFQNWTESPVTVVTDDGDINLAASTAWTIPEGSRQMAAFETAGIEGISSSCAITLENEAAVTGTVTRAGSPVSGANVTVGGVSATTGSDGKYYVSLTSFGAKTINVVKSLLATYSGSVSVTSGTLITQDIAMGLQSKWRTIIGSGDYDYAGCSTSEGGYATCGQTWSMLTGNGGDISVTKLDSSGNQTWRKRFGLAQEDCSFSIQQTSDNGYIVGGYSYTNDTTYGDGYVIKLDSSGNKTAEKYIGGSGVDIITSIIQNSDGTYCFTGYSSSTGTNGGNDLWVVKLNSDLTVNWQKFYGTANSDNGKQIIRLSDGYIVAGGCSGGDCYILRLDSSGNIVNSRTLGGAAGDGTASIIQATDGDFVLAANSSSVSGSGDVTTTNNGSSDLWLVKLSPDLQTIRWQKMYGGSDAEDMKSLKQTHDGGYIVAGATSSPTSGQVVKKYENQDCWVVKTDSNGDFLWSSCYGGNGTKDQFWDVLAAPDGGCLFIGRVNGTGGDVTGFQGTIDAWIVKTDDLGNFQ